MLAPPPPRPMSNWPVPFRDQPAGKPAEAAGMEKPQSPLLPLLDSVLRRTRLDQEQYPRQIACHHLAQ